MEVLIVLFKGRLQAEDPLRPVWALVDRNDWKDLGADQQARWQVQGRSHACVLVSLRD